MEEYSWYFLIEEDYDGISFSTTPVLSLNKVSSGYDVIKFIDINTIDLDHIMEEEFIDEGEYTLFLGSSNPYSNYFREMEEKEISIVKRDYLNKTILREIFYNFFS